MTHDPPRPVLTVRKAGLRDAPTVARVIRTSFREYRRGRSGPRSAFLTAREVRRQLRRRRKIYGMAVVEKQVVGAIGYTVKRRRLTFGPVGVLPAYRRFGIGRKLLDWVEARAKAHRCREVRAIVLRGLPALIAFYQSKGYSVYRTSRGLTIARKKL